MIIYVITDAPNLFFTLKYTSNHYNDTYNQIIIKLGLSINSSYNYVYNAQCCYKNIANQNNTQP